MSDGRWRAGDVELPNALLDRAITNRRALMLAQVLAPGFDNEGSPRDDGRRDAASRVARLRDAGAEYGGEAVSWVFAERDDGERLGIGQAKLGD